MCAKRLQLTFSLSFAVAMLAAKPLLAYYTDPNNWYYEPRYNSSEATLVKGYSWQSSGYSGDVTIPSTIANYTVTALGYSLFEDCTGLTSVNFPNTLKYVEGAVFWGCTALNTVNMNDGLVEIGSYAFADCSSLASIKIPETVKKVGQSAFSGCSHLQEVRFPAGIETIGYGILSECPSLTNIFVSADNQYYKTENGFLFTKDSKSIIAATGSRKNLLIPSPVTRIMNRAFYNYDGLNNLNIPGTVKTIGEWSFAFCSDITNLSISDGVESIGDAAFHYCNRLRQITLPASIGQIGVGAFEGWGLRSFYIADCNTTYKIVNDTIVTIDGHTLIAIPGGCAYANLPDGINEIPDSAFKSSYITEVYIPNSVTNIGYNAFRSTKLTTLTIPDSVMSIGEDAFSFSTSLGSVVVGSGVRKLGEDAFYYMSKLTNVVFKGLPPEGLKQADIRSAATIYYPEAYGTQWTNALVQAGLKKYQSYSNLSDIIPEKASRKYNLVLNPNGGAGSSVHLELETETISNLPLNSFTYEGFSFQGWATNATNKIDFYDGEAVKNLVGASGNSIELFAKWKPNEYSIIFHSNGGLGDMLPQVLKYGEDANISANSFVKTGYDFVGWSGTSDGMVIYTDEASISNLIETDGGTLDLYAVWQEGSILWPVITPEDGSVYLTPKCTVTISCESENATIYYSVDGATPRQNADFIYNGPFEIDGTVTVKAIAVKGELKSPYISATITQQPTTIAQAVDASELEFTTGRTSSWLPMLDGTAIISGVSARSGAMESPKRGTVESWLQVEVYGAGELSFWWKVDCEHDDSGDVTWDRLMYYVDNSDSDVARIDGKTEWEKKIVRLNSAGLHVIKWVYLKDNYDEVDADNADCAWIDGVTWIPAALGDPIPSATSDAEVPMALEGSADAALIVNVTNATQYTAYRTWALSVTNATTTAQMIKESTRTWLSFALGVDGLIEEEIKKEDITIDSFMSSDNEHGMFALEVAIKDINISSDADKARLATVLGVEGAASLNESAFSPKNVDFEIGTPRDGKATFTAKPKDSAKGDGGAFFMRVRVNQ